MLREERLQIILKMLETNQRVSSVELSEILNVSDDTIRRDLNELAENGLLKKVHGGAVPRSAHPYKLKERIKVAHEEKMVLAQKAQAYFHDGQVILLDNGSTNMEVARMMSPDLKATVFTNSLQIAQILCEHPSIQLFFLGGKVFKDAQNTYGAEVIEMLQKIRADICILGVCGIHHDIGVTIQDWGENQVKRKMVDISQKVVALVTASKVNTAESYVVCTLDELDVMLTDDCIDEALLKDYQKHDIVIQ
ncbi:MULTISPECIES: DeoR/GlpR family DNA-binding transcription regulator [Flectobacillus]|jgi:DeoR/GlpR family transcriptional regulator of sugar metabolism|uniref:DeoR/GlpR family DNA-binding transcription regulator n=1 Tax=Flectobacillus TaxID=101 RepID=UPI000BA3F692|nr:MULTISPECIES: DeoR/GlpR family DNA-binding transcription regulator [Flectobacillus]MDI9868784.1 DeoR/GlpR family DNA-binding transcription regulator [Flectobacillus roseus]NBA74267.1 DeoR family transcriptional regulator [Emticicia sp. ODNR4P]PAC30671.1 DeoR family transcriptional regulator [Flectobacillus sp. BAB-3569]